MKKILQLVFVALFQVSALQALTGFEKPVLTVVAEYDSSPDFQAYASLKGFGVYFKPVDVFSLSILLNAYWRDLTVFDLTPLKIDATSRLLIDYQSPWIQNPMVAITIYDMINLGEDPSFIGTASVEFLSFFDVLFTIDLFDLADWSVVGKFSIQF